MSASDDDLRDQVEILKEALCQMREAFAPRLVWPTIRGLEPKPRLMLEALMAQPVVTRRQFEVLLWADGRDAKSERAMDVQLLKVRRFLSSYGVKLQNSIGLGWRIADADKATLIGALSQANLESTG